MGDFRLKVKADLDAKDLESKLAKIKKDKIPITVEVKGDKKIENLEKSLTKLKSLNTVKINVDVSSLKSASAELKSLSSIVKSLSKDKININFPKSSVNSSNSKLSIKNTINDFKLLKNLAKEISDKKISLTKLDTVKNSSQISTLENQLKKLESDYNSLYKTLGKDLNVSQIGELEQIFGKASDKIDEMKSKAKDMANSVSGISKPFNQLDAVIASNRTLSWLKNNSKAAKEYGDILTELATKQKSVSNGKELQDLNKEFRQITSEAQAKGLTGKSVREEAKRAFSQITQFAGFYGAIQNIIFEVPRKVVSAVIDIDTAMTNLYKVTDETDARYSQFLDNAASKSKELGRSMSSYIEQTSEWAKRGFSLNDSQELARVSSIYANVGEVDDATAVSDITTAMKAFNIEASNAESIIDSLNILGNNFATSSADLGEGLSNSASSLATAGNDINQSLAMLTGMAEITQSAGEAGNALKILSMRVRGYDEETQSYSVDTEQLNGEIADLTKTAKTPGGISLFSDKDKQTYKSTYELMKDISEIYDDLSDKSQAALLEKLAGKNRGNQIAALLQAFKSGQVEKAYENSVNSEGSAQQEQDRWAQSIEARIEKFKASFQDFGRTMLSSDIFKAIISGATDLLNILTQIINVAGTLPAILGGGAIITFIKNLDKPTITGFTIKFPISNIVSLADIKLVV